MSPFEKKVREARVSPRIFLPGFKFIEKVGAPRGNHFIKYALNCNVY